MIWSPLLFSVVGRMTFFEILQAALDKFAQHFEIHIFQRLEIKTGLAQLIGPQVFQERTVILVSRQDVTLTASTSSPR